MKNKLSTTFEEVRREFKIVYRELFKGGRAELSLTDPDNILETGIDIKAEPPGKKLIHKLLLLLIKRRLWNMQMFYMVLQCKSLVLVRLYL